MAIVQPTIIAPDSSHWAKWLDAFSSPNADRRQRARSLHGRLIAQGRIPFLSWHHLEELLGGEDDAAAHRRIRLLQDMPLLAFFRLPGEGATPGSVAQVLAAEAIAASEGLVDLLSIRNRARSLLLRTGTGSEAIGDEAWVWQAMRPILKDRQGQTDLIAALGPLRSFDDSKTIGELSRLEIRSADDMAMQIRLGHDRAFREAHAATGGDVGRARAMADEFTRRVIAMMPPTGTTVRDVLVSALVDQGVDHDEIRDDCILADLNRLALFRNQLRAVAPAAGKSFEALKKVPMDMLPSRVIGEALKHHGQARTLRPGSDLNDGYLGVLAAYCGVLFVDKRTAEDFRRAAQKEPRLMGLIGEIAKGADFESLLS